MSDSDACATLAAAFDDVGTGYLVVVTGAGVSLASGIPTFRGTDPGAVWKRDVTELGTNRYFEEDPAGSWSWYTSRFDIVLDKQPNPAHRALAAIERWQVARGGRFLLVTQNVDPLHERAGSERLVKVHGSADRVRCSRHRCVHGAPRGSLPRAGIDMGAFKSEPVAANVPRCPSCGALLRQHVLWFDEFYDEHRDYQWGPGPRSGANHGCVPVRRHVVLGRGDRPVPARRIDDRSAVACHRPGRRRIAASVDHAVSRTFRNPASGRLREDRHRRGRARPCRWGPLIPFPFQRAPAIAPTHHIRHA